MLPIVTPETFSEVFQRRGDIGVVKTMLQDLKKVATENPEIAGILSRIWEALAIELSKLGFSEDTAKQLGLAGMDFSLMLYISLQQQAWKDKLPPLPKVSKAMAGDFVERAPTRLAIPAPEAAQILKGNPYLLREIMYLRVSFIRLIMERAREEGVRISQDEASGVATFAFNIACGIYELLEDVQTVEEMERIIRRK